MGQRPYTADAVLSDGIVQFDPALADDFEFDGLLRAAVVEARSDTRWPAMNREFQAFAARLERRPGDKI